MNEATKCGQVFGSAIREIDHTKLNKVLISQDRVDPLLPSCLTTFIVLMNKEDGFRNQMLMKVATLNDTDFEALGSTISTFREFLYFAL